MDEISEQLARRDRVRQMRALQKSPAERMQDMARLQRASWNMLRQSPEGYARFIRRNFKARAVPAQPADGN